MLYLLVLFLFALLPSFHSYSLSLHPHTSSHQYHTSQTTPTRTFPIPPPSYQCIVSINSVSEGYNVAYQEWRDGTNNLLRMDGRFQPTRITEVVKDDMIYRWDRHNTSEPCMKVTTASVMPPRNYSQIGNHSCDWVVTASSGIYDCFRDLEPSYYGTSTAARGILAEVWIANRTLSYPQGYFSINLTFYFASSTVVGIESRIPIRAELHAIQKLYGEASVRTMEQYWDWTAWTSRVPDASNFALPTVPCLTPARFPELILPRASQVLPNATIMAIPELPIDFSAVIETTGIDTQTTIASNFWHFSMPDDIATRFERVDYVDGGKDVTVVYDYTRADPSTPPPGKPANLGAGTSYTVKDNTCTRGVIAGSELSPLSTLRAGYTPTLFTNPTLRDNFIWSGRQFARGIPCDTWTKTSISWDLPGRSYVFDTTIYFAPQGWQYPGRNLPDKFRMPIRVVNRGVIFRIDDESRTSYNDIWDFFLLNPAPQSYNEWYNMTTTCPWVFIPDFDISATDAGATVAAIFGVLAGFVCIVSVYNKYRRVQRMKRREHRKVLETLNNNNQGQGNGFGSDDMEEKRGITQEPSQSQQPEQEHEPDSQTLDVAADDEYGVPEEAEHEPSQSESYAQDEDADGAGDEDAEASTMR